jgi:glucokinase
MTRYAVGVDIGGTSTKIAVVQESGEISSVTTIPTLGNGDPATFVAELLDRVADVRCLAAASERGPEGIGIAVAGLLDSRRDRLVYNPNLQPLVEFPLLAAFAGRFGTRVLLEVDSNAACLAEVRFGCARKSRRFLNLCAGTGLGVGVAVDGELVRIAYECAGDAGHVIVQPGGPLCEAGCRGCGEALVSASRLEARVTERLGRAVTAREAIDLAVAGNAAAQAALAETGYWLGLVMASLATVFFPDLIAISGGLAEAGDLLIGPATEAFRSVAAPFCASRVTVCKAEMGWQATVAGAVAPLL